MRSPSRWPYVRLAILFAVAMAGEVSFTLDAAIAPHGIPVSAHQRGLAVAHHRGCESVRREVGSARGRSRDFNLTAVCSAALGMCGADGSVVAFSMTPTRLGI